MGAAASNDLRPLIGRNTMGELLDKICIVIGIIEEKKAGIS